VGGGGGWRAHPVPVAGVALTHGVSSPLPHPPARACDRDLKPENILCSGTQQTADPSRHSSGPFGDVKIADFGLSKLVHPGELMTMACGTLQYCAPEVLGRHGYGREADLWSLGVILHLVVRGRLPFDDPDKEVVIARTLQAALDFSHPVWASWSREGLDFVTGLLAKDPAKRLTARRALQHPWLTASGGPPSGPPSGDAARALPHALAAGAGGALAATFDAAMAPMRPLSDGGAGGHGGGGGVDGEAAGGGGGEGAAAAAT
jgi:hypothetical protein